MSDATTLPRRLTALRSVRDFIDGARRWPLWLALGWNDVRQRYRRSVIGPFWLTLSVAVFIGALGVVYSSLFQMDTAEYVPYVTVGYLIWTFIATALTEGCTVFTEGESFIKQVQLPLSLFVFRLVWRNFIVFLHCIPVAIIVFIVFGITPGWVALLAIPGFLAIVVNAVWVIMLLGILCTRYRDLQPIVVSMLQVVFFLTPVFWPPSLLGSKTIIVDVNLLYHFIAAVREPLLGAVPSQLTYIVIIATTVVGSAVTMKLYGKFVSRVPYWL
jgi:ABC-type polysaccharide/polyol phosphate export permease